MSGQTTPATQATPSNFEEIANMIISRMDAVDRRLNEQGDQIRAHVEQGLRRHADATAARDRERLSTLALIPLTDELQSAAAEGKFVDLSVVNALGHSSFGDANTASDFSIVDGTLKASRKRVPITSEAAFFRCLNSVLAVYAGDDLSKSKMVLAYTTALATSLRDYALAGVMDADESHRRRMANDPQIELCHIGETLGRVLTANMARVKKQCENCHSSLHATSDCTFRLKRKHLEDKSDWDRGSFRRINDGVCGDFNSAKGCHREQCKFTHLCRKCNKKDCKKGRAKCNT